MSPPGIDLLKRGTAPMAAPQIYARPKISKLGFFMKKIWDIILEILSRISHWTRSVSKKSVIGPVQQTQRK